MNVVLSFSVRRYLTWQGHISFVGVIMLISAFVLMNWSQVILTRVMLIVNLHFDELVTLMVNSAIVKITTACWMV